MFRGPFCEFSPCSLLNIKKTFPWEWGLLSRRVFTSHACGVPSTCTFIGRDRVELWCPVLLEKLPSGLASWGFSWPALWQPRPSSRPRCPSLGCSLAHCSPSTVPSDAALPSPWASIVAHVLRQENDVQDRVGLMLHTLCGAGRTEDSREPGSQGPGKIKPVNKHPLVK